MSRIIIAIVYSALLTCSTANAYRSSLPCFDSDGDGWADPEVASDSCPPDNCPAYFNPNQSHCANVGDPNGDGMINIVDVVRAVSVAFRYESPDIDTARAFLQVGTDVNCDSATNVVDVVRLIDVAFRNVTEEFCRPCECECYPDYCDAVDTSGNLLPNQGSFERYCQGTRDGWWVSGFNNGVLIDSAAPGGGRWSIWLDGRVEDQWQTALVAEIPGAQAGDIYSFSVDGYSLGATERGGSFGHFWGYTWHYRDFVVYRDSGWTTIQYVDTLVGESPAGLAFTITWRCLYDNASVRYLGQAAP